MSDTIHSPGPNVPADLVSDYASDLEREVKIIEDGVIGLHVLIESMRREAERAKGTL
jgi:hypothetical protein